MKYRNLITSVAVTFLATAASASEPVEFNASVWLPQGHPMTEAPYVEWLPRLEEASGGTLKSNLFVGPVLLSPAAHLSGIRDGVAQIGYHAGTYTPSELPEANTIAMTTVNYSDMWVAAFASTEANLTIAELQDQWKRNNIVYLSGYSTPAYNLICRDEVATLEDLAGKKVRVPGAAQSAWAESVGMVPINVPSSEIFNGLDKGQLDCAAQPMFELETRSLWDVADHINMLGIGVYWSGFQHGVNRDFWLGLNDEQRKAFFTTLPEAMIDELLHFEAALTSARGTAEEKGVKFTEPTQEMLGSVENFKSVAIENAVATGRDKLGVENPEALIAQVEAIFAKWEGLLADVDRTDREAMIELAWSEIYSKLDPAVYALD